jgi:ABC-type uncharacterized transport system ATPase subunit
MLPPPIIGSMITLRHLTKHFGRTIAVDDLSLDVRPGR